MRSLVIDAPPAGGPLLDAPRHRARARVRLADVSASSESSYADHDDAALGKLIAARDPSALEELYDRHGAAAYRLACRVVVDEHLAHDVVQEVFLTIWRGAASYDGSRGPLRAWLFALTHHKAVDAVRGAQRHGSRRAPEDALQTRPDAALGVEEQAMRADDSARVRQALDALPEPQRKALLLAYFGGYSQSEIATLTDAPLGTVKTRTLAALRRLRTLLGESRLDEAGGRFPSDQGEGVWPR